MADRINLWMVTASNMLAGEFTIYVGNMVLRNIKVTRLKIGGVHISYNAIGKRCSAKIVLLKNKVCISNLKGHVTKIHFHKTIATVLQYYNNVKEYIDAASEYNQKMAKLQKEFKRCASIDDYVGMDKVQNQIDRLTNTVFHQ